MAHGRVGQASAGPSPRSTPFIALGRGDRIIPVAVAGRPHASDPALDCYPPALKAFDPDVPVALDYLDDRGLVPRNRQGVAGKRYSYAPGGMLSRIDCVDPDGNPTPNAQGWATSESSFDARGNEIQMRYSDRAGKAAIRKDVGIAAARQEHDDRGFPIRMRSFGEDGSRCFDVQGNAGWVA